MILMFSFTFYLPADLTLLFPKTKKPISSVQESGFYIFPLSFI